MKRLWTWLLLLALSLCGTAQAEVAVPKLTQRVTDLTGTLDVSQTQALNAKLAAFEARKGSQIAVLMLPTTQPETIEQYGIRVVDEWKLGRKGVDDGVLLLIAKDDRKLRIEVGYGLEGALNDATAKRIVSEVITPYFKQRDFYSGIDAGTDSIIKVIDGEPLPPPAASSRSASQSPDFGSVFGIAFVIFLVGNVILRQWFGLLPTGLIVGVVVGALFLLMVSLAWSIGAGLIAFLFSLIMGSNRWDFPSFPTGWGGGSGGGWSSGGGGDFSGGGGDFGGGGASGDW